MDKKEEVRESLKRFVQRTGSSSTILATVKSVDAVNFTCVLVDDDSEAEYTDVRLRPVLDDKESITVFPKVGTWAVAIEIEDDGDWMVIAVGEADKWSLKIGDTTIVADSTGIVINGGEFGGLAKVQETADKINALEQVVNNLINILSTTVIPLAPSGAYPFAPLYAAVSPILPLTVKTDIENTKVKH
jgi:hypothetical protein